MTELSRKTLGKASIATLLSTVTSVLIAASVVPVFGGTYDGLGMWLSGICPLVIAFPASTWQFHQSEQLRNTRDELLSFHLELDRMHSSLKLAHAALEHKSRFDAMTGALTREAFLNALNAANAKGKDGALLLADADHFKRINDTFGHQTGDEALMAIAGAIAATIGVNDFWGRIGGEEFAIFLDGSSTDEARAVADAMRRSTEATDIRREKGRVPVTISIGGVAVGPHFNTRQIIADADRRLYRAKRSGRNQVVIDEATVEDASAA
jgi:diguanylate cyclase (GGDEF)-like protein